MATEYSRFYPKATHMLFAVVVATSFQSATTTLIPIYDAIELPNLMATMTLAISYAVVILGWVRYARSESRWQYGDTRLGSLRFAFDLVTLFIYFYLLQMYGLKSPKRPIRMPNRAIGLLITLPANRR